MPARIFRQTMREAREIETCLRVSLSLPLSKLSNFPFPSTSKSLIFLFTFDSLQRPLEQVGRDQCTYLLGNIHTEAYNVANN